jgi:hypothetical protein
MAIYRDAMRSNASVSGDITTVDLEMPLRLQRAVEIAFPFGGMTVSGLRREAAKGRLVMERIAGKNFVTLRAINEMRELCRDQRKTPDCGLSRKNGIDKTNSSGAQHGSSETDRVKSARAALEMTAKGLSALSPTTLLKNTQFPVSADVIHLKS